MKTITIAALVAALLATSGALAASVPADVAAKLPPGASPQCYRAETLASHPSWYTGNGFCVLEATSVGGTYAPHPAPPPV